MGGHKDTGCGDRVSRSDPRAVLRARRRGGVLLGCALVVVVAAWTLAQVWLVASDLRAVRSTATALMTEIQTGSTTGLDDGVDTLQERAAAAADRTDSLTWRALTVLPVVGDDAEAAAHISAAAHLVADESVAPLAELGLDAADFAPRRGRIPLEPIRTAVPALAQAADGLTAARGRLEEVDRAGLLDGLVGPLDHALSEVTRAEEALTRAARSAELIPEMLGSRERRNYLVIFQNSAEVRSLGGMPGMVTTLSARRGRLTMGEMVPASSFGVLDGPVLPLTREERRIWGDRPGTWFQDAVSIPDFPRASELMVARFAQETGRQVDGVLSVDPAAMSYVVGAAGGVTVDGVQLSESTFVDGLVFQTYLRSAGDPEGEDAFFAQVAHAVLAQALGGGADPKALMDALARGVDQGRVLLHSVHEPEQAALAGTRLAGELPSGVAGPMQLGVYANDVSGSRMSYFLRHTSDLEAVSCTRKRAVVRGTTRVRSLTPSAVVSLPESITGSGGDGMPRGVQSVTFTLVGPAGGTIDEVRIDGRPTVVEVAQYRGRPVVGVPLWLEPQSAHRITWNATGRRSSSGTTAALRSTPGVKSGGKIAGLTPICGSN